MKTDSCAPGDPVWANAGILPNDECLSELPVIENSQVSSLLSNFEPPDKMLFHTGDFSQNMDIILPNHGYRLQNLETPLENNFMVLKDDKTQTTVENNVKSDVNFNDLLYFVCNLCLHLCTSKEKIAHHLKNAHSSENAKKLTELKCPACANIFQHKLSLRSHLIHDHSVCSFDINRIIQAVTYHASMKTNESNPIVEKKKVIKSTSFESNRLVDNDDIVDYTVPKEFTIFTPDKPELNRGFNRDSKCYGTEVGDLSEADRKSERNRGKLLLKIDQKKPFKCTMPICKVRMQDVKNLKFHMHCHSGNAFKCPECGEAFSFWKPLAGHLWRSHKIDMELYACNECDYKSFSLGKLNSVHKLIHSEVRSFACSVCHKGFKNKQQLRNHRAIHRDESERLLHDCEHCKRKFSTKRSRDLHVESIHKKAKPYSCTFCSYKSSLMTSLNMHLRQHTGERPFSCDECSYKTSDHNSLRRHKLRHSGQKPYKCSHCSYACIQSTTYKMHLKTKHPGLEEKYLFSCNDCQFRFINKEMYVTHMVSAHKKNLVNLY